MGDEGKQMASAALAEVLKYTDAYDIALLRKENDRLRTALKASEEMKRGWIDEYVKLRDMREMPDDAH